MKYCLSFCVYTRADDLSNGLFHSSHDSYVSARDQANMIRGKVDGINEGGEAFNTGFEASRQGEAEEDCFYDAWTVDRLNWMAGWEAGQ